jgi:hypothetical protein
MRVLVRYRHPGFAEGSFHAPVAPAGRAPVLAGRRKGGGRPGPGVCAALIGALRKYRPIAADDVAAAMIYAAGRDMSFRPGRVKRNRAAGAAGQGAEPK